MIIIAVLLLAGCFGSASTTPDNYIPPTVHVTHTPDGDFSADDSTIRRQRSFAATIDRVNEEVAQGQHGRYGGAYPNFETAVQCETDRLAMGEVIPLCAAEVKVKDCGVDGACASCEKVERLGAMLASRGCSEIPTYPDLRSNEPMPTREPAPLPQPVKLPCTTARFSLGLCD